MRKEISSILNLIFGLLGTLGGWYMFLLMFDLVPMPEFSILATIVMWCGLGTILAAQLFAGPMIVWDVIKKYREDKRDEVQGL